MGRANRFFEMTLDKEFFRKHTRNTGGLFLLTMVTALPGILMFIEKAMRDNNFKGATPFIITFVFAVLPMIFKSKQYTSIAWNDDGIAIRLRKNDKVLGGTWEEIEIVQNRKKPIKYAGTIGFQLKVGGEKIFISRKLFLKKMWPRFYVTMHRHFPEALPIPFRRRIYKNLRHKAKKLLLWIINRAIRLYRQWRVYRWRKQRARRFNGNSPF